jgi:hypothetical protein
VDRLHSHLGQNFIFVTDNPLADADLRQVFEQVEWDPPLPLWRRPAYSEPIRVMHIARCRGFRRFVGLEWADGG